MLRILVCGGRDYLNEGRVFDVLDEYGQDVVIIHGAAPGADSLAQKWAIVHNIQQIPFKADWNTYGKAAGPIRNSKMLQDGKPDLVIAFPGGTGTADMVRKAKKANIQVIKIEE